MVLFSCLNNDNNKAIQVNEDIGLNIDKTEYFENYKWDTLVTVIENELGEPIIIQPFQQYGKEVTYYQYGEKIIYGYETLYWFTFIEKKLVGGGYYVLPDEDIKKNNKLSKDTYIKLQNDFIELYGDPKTSSKESDKFLNRNMSVPENYNDLSEEAFIRMCPFETFWGNGNSMIKLSLNYDDGYLVMIDIFGPTLLHLIDLELADLLKK
jgi:hypothetical protein